MRKLLLIGGSGGIGQGLIPLLNKYEVHFTDSKQLTLPSVKNMISADIIINLAALISVNELHKFSLLSKKLIDVNCLGSVNILASCLPQMRLNKYGRIILMSSVFSEINIKGYGVYSASKAFVDKLVKIAAIENAQYGITVNSIQLGYTGIGMGVDSPEEARNKPSLKRFCRIDELHKAIEFIIETEYYTGQNLRIDGGIK